MKPELIQLLQHEDKNNRLIGCWLAYHAGYSTVEIFDSIPTSKIERRSKYWSNYIGTFGNSNDSNTPCYVVGDYLFKIWSLKKSYPKTGKDTTFSIYHKIDSKYQRIEHVNINKSENSKQYQQTFNNMKHIFMEYVLSEE